MSVCICVDVVSVWKWRHVCVFLRRGEECWPRLHQHPGRPLGRCPRCFIRPWWESAGVLWRRRNSHCVEAGTTTTWPAYHMNFDPCVQGPPKIRPGKFLWRKNDLLMVIDLIIYIIIPPEKSSQQWVLKMYTPQKKISGYVHACVTWLSLSPTSYSGCILFKIWQI